MICKLECIDSDGNTSLRDSQTSLHKIEQTYTEMDSIYNKLCMVKDQKFLTGSKLPRTNVNLEADHTQRRLAFSDQKDSGRGTGRFPVSHDMELVPLQNLSLGDPNTNPNTNYHEPRDPETAAVLTWLKNNPRSHNQLIQYQQSLFQTGFPSIVVFARRLLEDEKFHYTADEVSKILASLTTGASFGRFTRYIAGILSNPSFLSKAQLAAIGLVFGAGRLSVSLKEVALSPNGGLTVSS